MSGKPHARDKRVVNKTIKVEKKALDNNKNNKNNNSVLSKLFGALIKK